MEHYSVVHYISLVPRPLHVCRLQYERHAEGMVRFIKCDPLSKNSALCANIEFELEAILSVQVVSQLNYTNVSQEAWTVSY